MQIFQRGINQSVVIGQDMVVTVLEIQSTFVRIGITDPHSDPVYWEETLFVNEDADFLAEEDGDTDATSFDSAEFACPAY